MLSLLKKPTFMLGVAMAMLFSVQSAGAGTIGVSNLAYSGPFEEGWDLGGVPTTGGQTLFSVATSFTTGTGAGWALDSIVLPLLGVAPPQGEDQAARFALVADNNGAPDVTNSVGTFAQFKVPDTGFTYQPFTITPFSSVTLAPQTTYWLVGDYFDDNYVYWRHSDDLRQTGLSGWTIGDVAMADRGGVGSWEVLSLGGDRNKIPTLFEVNVTPVETSVPDAGSTMALLGLALAGLAAARRRL